MTLNAVTGAITANAAIVPAGSAGQISVYASNDTDVVIDVNGYFGPPGSGGLSLYTVTPCRVLDTRTSSGELQGALTANVSGSSCGALATAGQAFVLNATVVPAGSLTFLTLSPNGDVQPTVSTLNALDGAITSNMAIVPTTNGWLDAFATVDLLMFRAGDSDGCAGTERCQHWRVRVVFPVESIAAFETTYLLIAGAIYRQTAVDDSRVLDQRREMVAFRAVCPSSRKPAF